MRSASSRAIASPRPMPRAAAPGPRKKRSKTRSSSSGGMPGPSSDTIDAGAPRRRLGAQRDRRARRRVPQGVVDEHAQHLQHAALVAAGERGIGALDDDHVRAAPARERLHLAGAVGGEHAELELVLADGDAAGVEPREVEQVGRQLRQPLHLLAHRLEELAALGLGQPALREQLEIAAERRQRRPQLVRGVGDEGRARALERLEADRASPRASARARRSRRARGRRSARRTSRARCDRRRARRRASRRASGSAASAPASSATAKASTPPTMRRRSTAETCCWTSRSGASTSSDALRALARGDEERQHGRAPARQPLDGRDVAAQVGRLLDDRRGVRRAVSRWPSRRRSAGRSRRR